MSDPTYPLYPIVAFLAFALSLVPLPWHLQAWNSGTCAFMIWTAANCLVKGINSIVWHGNVLNVVPVWCDISSQIMLAANIGTPASILCISRRLYKITSIQNVSITRADKRRDIFIDLGIAVGIPFIILALHTIVHAHRFDIVEDIGCYPVTYHTLPSYFLYYPWPILLGCVSFIYSGLTLRSFFIRRAQFASLLSSTSSMNMNRYIRLMLLSIVDMSFTVPLAIYILYVGTDGIPLSPWISWEDTHYNWNRVEVVPTMFWRSIKDYEITIELTRWLAPFCAFTFFALFGFASEATKNYKKGFWAVAKRLGYKPKTNPPKFTMPSWNDRKPTNTDSQATLPVYAVSHSPPKRKGSSFCSPDDEGLELQPYSPGTDKTAPPTYASSFEDASHRACASASQFSFDDAISISEPMPASCRFEDDFKPLPPLPAAEPRRFTTSPMETSPYEFSPYASLRHAVSMPLPRTAEKVAIQRGREGSLTVVVEQCTRVDRR